MKDIRIAIDGPASSGKSTVAKIIAKNLGYTYLDTEAIMKILSSASGKTTVPISRPSMMIPP